MTICDACETVAHCSRKGCIPLQPAPVHGGYPTPTPDPIRAALAELVALKDLKYEINRRRLAGAPTFDAEVVRMESDYIARKPKAWVAARVALCKRRPST